MIVSHIARRGRISPLKQGKHYVKGFGGSRHGFWEHQTQYAFQKVSPAGVGEGQYQLGASPKRLEHQRNCHISHELHLASHHEIALLVQAGIGTLIIGTNDGWKQEIDLG